MWKVHTGLMYIVDSFIFGSSFFCFPFLVPFLHMQIAIIVDISIAIRDTRSEVAERVILIIIKLLMSRSAMVT